MIISAQQDTCFYEGMPKPDIQGRISLKPVGISELRVHFSTGQYWTKPVFRVFRIDCTSSLEAVTFTDDYMTFSVELLVVHCSAGGSSLQISGLSQGSVAQGLLQSPTLAAAEAATIRAS
jgi:hypothetical protein